MTKTETVSTERLEELLRLEIGERDRYLEGTFLWLKHDDKANAFAELITKRTLVSRTQSPAEWEGLLTEVEAAIPQYRYVGGSDVRALIERLCDALRAASIPAPERSKEETGEVREYGWAPELDAVVTVAKDMAEHLTGKRPSDDVAQKAAVFLHNCIAEGALSPLYAVPAPVPVTITPEQAAIDALQPFHDAVFNANGDITVNGPYDYEFAVAAYFAHRKLTASLTSESSK